MIRRNDDENRGRVCPVARKQVTVTSSTVSAHDQRDAGVIYHNLQSHYVRLFDAHNVSISSTDPATDAGADTFYRLTGGKDTQFSGPWPCYPRLGRLRLETVTMSLRLHFVKQGRVRRLA